MSQHRDDESVLAESHDAGGGRPTEASRPRRELIAWRNAVFAIFFLSGLSLASWVARLPAVRDDTGLSTQGVGLVIMGGSIGVVLGLIAAPSLMARFGARAGMIGALVDRRRSASSRRHRRLDRAVGPARRHRARAVRIRQRRGRRDDERRGRRGRAARSARRSCRSCTRSSASARSPAPALGALRHPRWASRSRCTSASSPSLVAIGVVVAVAIRARSARQPVTTRTTDEPRAPWRERLRDSARRPGATCGCSSSASSCSAWRSPRAAPTTGSPSPWSTATARRHASAPPCFTVFSSA